MGEELMGENVGRRVKVRNENGMVRVTESVKSD